MDYHAHKDHFNKAYATGTDIWTPLTIPLRGTKLIKKLPAGASILDVGSGRGLFAKQLADMGFKVIGIDFEDQIVSKVNGEIKHWGLEGKLKFVTADALKLPFVDNSFDGVCAFGLMESLHKKDWPKYAAEIRRMLKPGGFYLNMSFSRKTINFINFSPIASPDGELEKHGIHYHFFEDKEMAQIFDKKLTLISQEIEFIKKPVELGLLESLFQKPK